MLTMEVEGCETLEWITVEHLALWIIWRLQYGSNEERAGESSGH